MNYQNLTFTQLRGLLTERAVVGRSKATTKEKAIALLEECDRLTAVNDAASESTDNSPAVTSSSTAEQPKFRTESEFSGDPSISETAPLRTVEVTSAILETAPCFRLDVSQIENLLTKLVNKSINRQRGEDVAFVNAPKDLASGVDRAISSYLTKVGFDFMGRINLTAKYVAIDAEVQSIVASPLIDTIYGWEIHSCGVCYGKPSSSWKFIFQPQLIFNEMSHALVADLYEIATTKLRTKLSRQFFGPLAIDNLAALRGPQLPEWLATSDGHWHVRWKPEHIDVFRWWWSQSSGGRWKLDYSRVISKVQGYRCLCGSEHCKHLGIVEKFQQKLQQVERQKQFAELEKKRQSEFAQTTKERQKLIEFLRENHFKLASDIGFALFRQPFWSLSLNHLKQINQEILSQVKQP